MISEDILEGIYDVNFFFHRVWLRKVNTISIMRRVISQGGKTFWGCVMNKTNLISNSQLQNSGYFSSTPCKFHTTFIPSTDKPLLQLSEDYYWMEGIQVDIPQEVMAEHSPPKGITIGLSGPAGSGKSTVADYLKLKYDFEEIAFAGPLKEVTSKLFDIPLTDMYDPIKKEVKDERYKKSPRQLLQWFGTDVMRETFDEDFWIKQAFWKYDRITREDPSKNVIFSDCRFDNEAGPIAMIPDSMVCVMDASNRLAPKQSPLLGNTRVHSTENGISGELINETIDNNGNVESLYENIDELYNRLRKKQQE